MIIFPQSFSTPCTILYFPLSFLHSFIPLFSLCASVYVQVCIKLGIRTADVAKLALDHMTTFAHLVQGNWVR